MVKTVDRTEHIRKLKEGENHPVSVVGMITGKCSALTEKQAGGRGECNWTWLHTIKPASKAIDAIFTTFLETVKDRFKQKLSDIT